MEEYTEEEPSQNEMISRMSKKYNDFNVMQIRLESDRLIAQIEKYLRGGEITYITEQGTNNYSAKKVNFGYPLANEKGIQSLINWISMHINPQTVQGNFLTRNGFSQEFQDFMYFFHTALATHLMDNMERYDIDEAEYSGIITVIRNLVERFLSRSIGNLERESYGETFKSVENFSNQRQGGLLRGIMAGGGGGR